MFLFYLFVAYVLLLLVVRLFERRMIFFPDYPSRLEGEWHPRALAPEDVWLTASDGTKLHAWWISHPAAKFTFLAFHGNASNIANREPTYEFLRDTPANVLALEYRGYGHSEGKPSEAGLYLDAEAAYQFLINTKRLDPKSILSFGQSLGTTVAADVAAHHKVGALILEAPLPSASRAASKMFWFLPGLSLLVYSQFDTISKLKQIRAPVMVVQCTHDPVLSFQFARRSITPRLRPSVSSVLRVRATKNRHSSRPSNTAPLSNNSSPLWINLNKHCGAVARNLASTNFSG